MRPDYIDLSAIQVAVAAALIAINAAISLALKLGLERRLAVASVRTVAQLTLIGFVLDWVFAVRTWPVVLGLAAIMAAVAGVAAVRRTERRYDGIWLNALVSMWASSWLIAGVAVAGVVQVDPWWEPQYAIPLLGMILGNTLNGISLGLDRLTEELVSGRDRVEALLTLGATRWEAAREPVRAAVRTGMIPIVNSMMVVGIVSIPGMMTGQLLAGVDPLSAVEYQIVIMFLIASGTALGTVGVVLLGYRRLFNPRHQFLYHAIERR
ncbi:MAG: iron export ABC transporter permease subunit FetB [Gemmatimonadota bacterium]|nr:iron export ABC transporter permease subunit FetB [Gemmatimonadota bacterium]